MTNFEKLGLHSDILKAVQDLGFEDPSEIQNKAIPLLLQQDTDLVALAQTGTGKTAAFGFPLLQKNNKTASHTQALILSPTRELCLQITNELKHYSKYIRNLKTVAIYGGASISQQKREIDNGAHIIVATPGRMKDMLGRGMIDISKIEYCVLDEADEMLNMGFYEDISAILEHSPKDKKTWLFSATMPKEVSKIAKKFMSAPVEITAGPKNEGTKNVSHEFYVVGARNRYQALRRLADANPTIFSVIFCRTKRETRRIAEHLIEDGYNADAIHGDLSQAQRDEVMKGFRKKKIQMLVATDVAARGIDINDITHVINYQLPDQPEIYTHRSGRTGRAGKSGISMVIITKNERRKIKQIEKLINQKFTEKEIPSGDEICQNQLFHLAHRVKTTEINPAIDSYFELLEENFRDLTKEELTKKMFSVEFSRFLTHYKNAPDLTAKGNYREGEDTGKSTRYFINLGSRDGFNWMSLKDFLKEQLTMGKDEVTRVDVKNNFAFFNTDTRERDKVFGVFKNFEYQGRSIKVEVTKNKDNPRKKKKSKKGRKRSGKSARSSKRKRNKW